MTALGRTASAPAFALQPAVLALARVEGARLLRHPVVLLGTLLSVLVSMSTAGAVALGGPYLVLTGPTLLPLGIATLVAANLAAVRSVRSRTRELYVAAPAPRATRALAQLLALAWPAGLAALLIAAAAAAFGAWDGLRVDASGAMATPSLQELLQAPATVVLMGACGVALGRWVPHPAASLVVAVGLFAIQMPAAMWDYQEARAWFLPIVNPAETAPGASWPCSDDPPSPCPLEGFATTAMAWHLAYVAGLTALLGAVALLRDARPRSVVVLGVLGAAVAAAAGVLQVA